MSEINAMLADLQTRLKDGEVARRRLFVAVCALSVAVVSQWLLGAEWTGGKTIEAEHILLRGSDGAVRMELKSDVDGRAALLFYDKEKKEKMAITQFKDNTGIVLYDKRGEITLHLGVTPAGPEITVGGDEKSKIILTTVQDTAALSLYDSKKRERSRMSLSKDNPFVCFLDEKHKIRGVVGHRSDGPYIKLGDVDEKVRVMMVWDDQLAEGAVALNNGQERTQVMLSTKEGALPGLVVFDARQRPRLYADLTEDGPRLELRDSEGKTIFKQP